MHDLTFDLKFLLDSCKKIMFWLNNLINITLLPIIIPRYAPVKDRRENMLLAHRCGKLKYKK